MAATHQNGNISTVSLQSEILSTIRAVINSTYPMNDMSRIEIIIQDVFDLFSGSFEGFQGCDTLYHDLEHTFQVVHPFVQIIDGLNKSGRRQKMSFRFFELGVAAALLHDTGYIKREGDTSGTGGKYTFVHIGRGVSFAKEYLSSRALNFSKDDITAVGNMIYCTGVVDLVVRFSCDEERICGFAVGIADLIGQLSAHNYPEKLPHLYDEFKEAYDYEGRDNLRARNFFIFSSPEALIRSTAQFYKKTVKKRFKEMESLDECIKYHEPERSEYYKAAIEKNLMKINSFDILENSQ